MPFSIVHERALGSILHASLCPSTDLLALSAADGGVSVLRWLAWQRAFTLSGDESSQETPTIGFSWSPDGSELILLMPSCEAWVLSTARECAYPMAEGFAVEANPTHSRLLGWVFGCAKASTAITLPPVPILAWMHPPEALPSVDEEEGSLGNSTFAAWDAEALMSGSVLAGGESPGGAGVSEWAASSLAAAAFSESMARSLEARLTDSAVACRSPLAEAAFEVSQACANLGAQPNFSRSSRLGRFIKSDTGVALGSLFNAPNFTPLQVLYMCSTGSGRRWSSPPTTRLFAHGTLPIFSYTFPPPPPLSPTPQQRSRQCIPLATSLSHTLDSTATLWLDTSRLLYARAATNLEQTLPHPGLSLFSRLVPLGDNAFRMLSHCVHLLNTSWGSAQEALQTAFSKLEKAVQARAPSSEAADRELRTAKLAYPCSPLPLASLELWRSVHTGASPSGAFTAWLEGDLGESALVKLTRTLEGTFSGMESLCVTRAVPALEVLLGGVLGGLLETGSNGWTSPSLAAFTTGPLSLTLGMPRQGVVLLAEEVSKLLELLSALRSLAAHARALYSALFFHLRLALKDLETGEEDSPPGKGAAAAGAAVGGDGISTAAALGGVPPSTSTVAPSAKRPGVHLPPPRGANSIPRQLLPSDAHLLLQALEPTCDSVDKLDTVCHNGGFGREEGAEVSMDEGCHMLSPSGRHEVDHLGIWATTPNTTATHPRSLHSASGDYAGEFNRERACVRSGEVSGVNSSVWDIFLPYSITGLLQNLENSSDSTSKNGAVFHASQPATLNSAIPLFYPQQPMSSYSMPDLDLNQCLGRALSPVQPPSSSSPSLTVSSLLAQAFGRWKSLCACAEIYTGSMASVKTYISFPPIHTKDPTPEEKDNDFVEAAANGEYLTKVSCAFYDECAWGSSACGDISTFVTSQSDEGTEGEGAGGGVHILFMPLTLPPPQTAGNMVIDSTLLLMVSHPLSGMDFIALLTLSEGQFCGACKPYCPLPGAAASLSTSQRHTGGGYVTSSKPPGLANRSIGLLIFEQRPSPAAHSALSLNLTLFDYRKVPLTKVPPHIFRGESSSGGATHSPLSSERFMPWLLEQRGKVSHPLSQFCTAGGGKRLAKEKSAGEWTGKASGAGFFRYLSGLVSLDCCGPRGVSVVLASPPIKKLWVVDMEEEEEEEGGEGGERDSNHREEMQE